MTKFLKKIAPFLILVSFLILSALLPEILGEDVKTFSKNYLGENYKYILVAFFLLLFFFAAYIRPEIGMGIFSKKDRNKPERFNLPATERNRQLLINAKKAVSEANHIEALKCLSELNLQTLDIEISTLSARLAQLRRTEMHGTQSPQGENRALNEISVDLLNLIKALEREIEESFAFYEKIKVALKTRYENRLNQKLSRRQPVNLRLLPSTTGTTPQAAATFVQYNEEEIRKQLKEYFEDASGRLLIVGVPGAGKTTLLLQLELELLEKEATLIPIILNLARWSSEFPNLESWIQEILPSEMGLTINKKTAADLISQNQLILLLDGLDEVKPEDRQACLEAVGIYGENPNRLFIISSRIDEYIAVAKDAPVNNQVEVGTLTYNQLIEQLEKADQNEGAKRLLAALKEDVLLREIAEVPFYFNTLQLLFARGKYLHEFNFLSTDKEARKKEIENNFVWEMLCNNGDKELNFQLTNKYLGFFTSRLKRYSLVDFELTHLQYNWCYLSKWDFFLGNFLENLCDAWTFGLMFMVIYGWIFDLIKHPIVLLVTGLTISLSLSTVGGLIDGLRDRRHPKIATKENIIWDWNKIFLVGRGNIMLGAIFILIIGLTKGVVKSLIVGLIILLFNQIIMGNFYAFIQVNDPYQRFKASAKVFYFSILQHWHLRYLLHKKGLLPKKLVPFLNEMVACNILETTGASWRFRHRILQDYFADQWVETEFEPEQK